MEYAKLLPGRRVLAQRQVLEQLGRQINGYEQVERKLRERLASTGLFPKAQARLGQSRS